MHGSETIRTAPEILRCVQQVREVAAAPVGDDAHETAAFVEISRKHSEVYQIGPYRVVYTEPPVSAKHELTIVRPVKKL